MKTPTTIPRRGPLPTNVVPPLEQGDKLTRDEFERRFDAMPNLKKAELIEGVVHMPSPVRWIRHGSPHSMLIGWLGFYWAHTPGVQVGSNASIRLDPDNMPQPDATLLIDPACGGQARISADDYVELAPEWLGEVSASTVRVDLDAKLRVYEQNRVKEYVVWRVLEQSIDWFILRKNQFERLAPTNLGIYKSEVFPGLWLDRNAILGFDLPRVLEILKEGLATPEHATFVARLQQISQSSPKP